MIYQTMRQTLFLIDAFSHIFRAYFAIRTPMKSPSTGEPTNAVYGFVAMLLRLLNQYPDALIFVAFDSPGATFRDELFPEYKGTRVAIPEDLLAQVPRIAQMLDAMGIGHHRIDGLEADDVIASITHAVLNDARPEASTIDIRILSNDKDLEQLICDRVGTFDPSTNIVFDTDALLTKKGIRPDQVIDYLTMIGDTVDNVPGIDRIGPKSAAKYLQTHGSLDGIYENLTALTASHRAAFEAGREQTTLSRTLVTLRRDAMPEFLWEQTRRRAIDSSDAIALCEELGFNRFPEALRKLCVAPASEPLA